MMGDYEAAFRSGRTFERLLEEVEASRAMWHAVARRAAIPPEVAAAAAALPGTWRFLALSEEWCGDGVNTLPVVAALSAAAGIELRIVARDEHPELMDRHLTNGARSIPVVILLDEDGRPRGHWGPRPGPLQAWFEREGRGLDKDARYKELRRWYARDRGRTTAEELLELVRAATETEAAAPQATETAATRGEAATPERRVYR